MKKIAFWICGNNLNIDELLYIKLFCEELPSQEYEYYILSKDNLKNFHENSFKNLRINILTFKDIFNITFDILILSDYYSFVEFNVKTEIEKKAYYYLLSLNIPVLTFDAPVKYPLSKHSDICFIHKLCIKKKFEICQTCNPPKVAIIYPSPPHDAMEKCSPCKIYNWRLPIHQITEQEKKNVISQIIPNNWGEDVRIVFFSVTHNDYSRLKLTRDITYLLILEKLFIHLFKQPEQKICLIIVSPVSFYDSLNTENIYIKHLLITENTPINCTYYENFVLSSDIIFTINILQNTFWLALCHGIPGINLNFVLPQTGSIDYNLTPFSMEMLRIIDNPNLFFPLNPFTNNDFSNSLNPSLQKREIWGLQKHTDLFNTCEISDENKIISLINKYLNDKKFKEELIKTKNRYLKNLSEFLSAKEIIEDFLNIS